VSLQVNLLLPHPEDPKWMEVYMPPYLVLQKEKKTFFYGSIQHHQDCYLLPAAPSVYEAMAMQFEPHKVLLRESAPKGYLMKQNLPNRNTGFKQN
jgi:hypothetical protein